MLILLKNLKTKSKLVLSFSIVILFFVIATGVTYINITAVNNAYTNLVEVHQNILLDITAADETISKMSAAMRGYALYKDDKFYNEYLQLREQFSDNMEGLEALIVADKQKVDMTPVKELEADYFAMAQEMYRKGQQGDYEGAAQVAIQKGRGIAEQLLPKIAKFTQDQKDIIQEESRKSSEQVNNTIKMLLILSLLAILVAVISILTINRFVTAPIHELNSVMQKVAEGDLRVMSSYQSKDELGAMTRYFNSMVDSLKQIIAKINEDSTSLMASTQQISASTQEIASGSEEQANAAQTINSLTNEMANAIEEVAKSAEQAALSSREAVKVARNSGEIVNNSIKGMDAISEKIADLEQNSQQIGDIVDVIDDVAEQTNLLALNAAIEAARAGDAGKGFAVVADEVRKLAERSSAATKDIALLIKNIQKNTGETVKVVNAGVTLTKQLGNAFDNIITSIETTSNKVSDIAAASEEQAAQAADVVNAVQNIAAVTEEASAGAEETAATSQEIARMAEELTKAVSKFRLA